MQLTSIHFIQHEGKPSEWVLAPLEPERFTLLVGKNATGKSKTLAVVDVLARLLRGETAVSFLGSAAFHAEFDGGRVKYSLAYDEQTVTHEVLAVDGTQMLNRVKGDESRIYSADTKTLVRFQPPPGAVAAFARRDSIQHPFLDELATWATGVALYRCSSELGKNTFAFLAPNVGPEPNWRDSTDIVALFHKGRLQFGESFVASILSGMRSIGYDVEAVSADRPSSVRLPNPLMGFGPEPVCLVVKERDLECGTDQADMSVGMFRALAIIIHTEYATRTGAATCLLIDDIGEGLDHERATQLVTLLHSKSCSSNCQFVLSTNSRFVMNAIPLVHWSVLVRNRNVVSAKSYKNSREVFEKFAFTGLNNFDFFAMDFINSGHTLGF